MRGTTISATPPDRPTPPRPARIRGLLARALDQGDTERFWSLAVATQLIEEHLADLHRRAARPPSAPYGWRAWRACRAWEVLRAIVLALLGR